MGEEPSQPEGLVAGRRRVIVVTAGIAIASLVVGMAVASRITSPGEAAARAKPPDGSRITVPVERRVVRSEVVTRGDVVYDGATDVAIGTSALSTPAVVTGQVPHVGDTIDAGGVILQVVGRPVIALPGSFPAYRTLSPGLSGPDVLQLKAALAALGLNPGDVSNDRYDQTTGVAVAQLYGRVGYAVPVADESISSQLEAARENVTAAEEGVTGAQQELATAGKPASESERLAAEAAISAAQRRLATAEAEGDASAIAEARAEVALAQAQRDELLAPKNTAIEQAALTQAQARLNQARTEAGELETQAGTPLPVAEVVFLPSLPRRVDTVSVTQGKLVDGPVMRVSGADMVIVAALSGSNAQLVKQGMPVKVAVGDDTVEGSVVEVRQAPALGGGAGGEGGEGDGGEGGGGEQGGGGQGDQQNQLQAVVKPAALTPEQVELIRGANVKLTIPVQATEGEVLAVPLAALSAGSGGESRVQVQRADDKVERVVVEVGLTAGGFAEVRATEGSLEEGDLVVVGR